MAAPIPMPKVQPSRQGKQFNELTTTLSAVVTAINDVKAQNEQLMQVLAGNEKLGQTGLIFKVQAIEAGLNQLSKTIETTHGATNGEIERMKQSIETLKANQAKAELELTKLKDAQDEDEKEKASWKSWFKGVGAVLGVLGGIAAGLLTIYQTFFSAH